MSRQIVLSDITKDLVIAEYNALREEVNQLYKMQQSVMLQSLVLLGALVGFFMALKNDYNGDKWIFFLPIFIIPAASYVIIFTSLGLHLRATKINFYLFLLTKEYGIVFEYNGAKYHGWSEWYASKGNRSIDRIDLAPILLSLVAVITLSISLGLYWLSRRFLFNLCIIIFHFVTLAIGIKYAIKLLKEASEIHNLKL